MNPAELQQQLFRQIKSRMGESKSVPEEIASLLGISPDSVYRRMRGEKTISLEELYLLCTHYNISLDQLMNIRTGSFLFQGAIQDSGSFRFEDYLKGILSMMEYFNTFQEKRMYYLAKDIPIFYHFHSREIAAFKYYFWMRTILKVPSFTQGKIRLSEYPGELFDISKKITRLYYQLDSVEFWGMETLNSTLRQVDYYREGNFFESKDDVWKIYDALERLLHHVEHQAEQGFKYEFGDPDMKPLAKYELYFNEIIIADNSILVQVDKSKMAFMVHSVINHMVTRDPAFCDNMYNYLQTLMEKSTLLSSSSAKERARFFRITREKIASRKNSL